MDIQLCNAAIQHNSATTILIVALKKTQQHFFFFEEVISLQAEVYNGLYAHPISLHQFLWESMCNVTQKIWFLMLPRCSWILLPLDWYKYRSDVLKYNIVLINRLCSQKSAGMCGQVRSKMRDIVGTWSTGTDCASYKSKIQTLITKSVKRHPTVALQFLKYSWLNIIIKVDADVTPALTHILSNVLACKYDLWPHQICFSFFYHSCTNM